MKKTIALLFMTTLMIIGNEAFSQTISSFNADKFHYAISEDKKPQILDVRTKAEFDSGHLKNAINIDVKSPEFQKKALKKLKKEKIVYVYCRSGIRSMNAAKILEKLGFKTIYNLEGGIIAWKKADKPIKQKKDKGNL